MALSGILGEFQAQYSISTLVLSSILLLSISHILYRTYTDPLQAIPGPLLCRFTPLWAWYHSFLGDESRQIQALHEKYGPVIRIGPNDVVISDGEALAPIYSEKGGFLKAPCYKSFDSEGHETIFSTLDPKHRSVRSKAVMPMFSTGNLRENGRAIEGCVDAFVERLKKEAESSRKARKETGKPAPVDVLNLSRSMAIDAVCAYLFGHDYGGVREEGGKLSATEYVDSIVSLGRLFFLPPWLFQIAYMVYAWLQPADPELDGSAGKVNGFTTPLVKKSTDGEGDDGTYQSRLLKAGISFHETDVQMKDVIFAGTDTTGMNLSTIIWNLAKHPECYKKLQQEIADAEQKDPNYNPQNLRYLDGVIREGLRTSLANPTRFPRQVPPSGFTYKASDGRSYHMPAGTLVGIQPFTLHFNLEVFPDPHEFRPERWANATPAMLRDWMPFGLGPRQCIARNLAMVELAFAVRALARANVLEGAKVKEEKIEVLEWFNAVVVGGKIELSW